MIPADAPLVAFLAVIFIIGFLPACAIVVGVVVIDIRVRRALVAHSSTEQKRVDDIIRRLLPAPRVIRGFVLREGDSERRPRGADVYEPAPSEDAAGVVRERA